MNEEVETVARNAQELAVIKQAAAMIRNNGRNRYKGVTPELRKQWALSAKALFSDPQFDFDLVWDEFSLLPNDVIVGGLTSAWQNMTAEQRQLLHNRIKVSNPDRAAIQRIQLVLELMDIAPLDALRFFSDIAPKHPDTVRQAGNLLALDYVRLQKLFPTEAEVELLSKAVEKAVLLIQNDSVNTKPRWSMTKAILCFLAERQLSSNPLFSESVRQLAKIALGLPPELQSDLKGFFGNMRPVEEVRNPASPIISEGSPAIVEDTATIKADAFPTNTTELSHAIPESFAAELPADPDPKLATSPNLKEFAVQWRTMLKMQLDLLEKYSSMDQDSESLLRDQLSQAREAEKEAVASAEEAKRELAGSELRLREAENRIGLIQERLRTVQEQMREADGRLAEALAENTALRYKEQAERVSHVQEIESLNRRITMNADLRLKEFREALAEDLAGLLSTVPDRQTTDIDPELGRVLLLRIHQIMDRLEREGMKVRAKGRGL